ncbi:hypothetical protein COOONC_15889, partial [Cooperia oncophora]
TSTILDKEYIPGGDGWVGSFRMRAKRSYEDMLRPMPKPIQMDHYTLGEGLNQIFLWFLSDSDVSKAKPSAVAEGQRNKSIFGKQNKKSFLAVLAKKLVHTVRLLKNKDKDYKSWQTIISEISEEGRKLKQKQKARKLLEKRLKLFKKTLNSEGVNHPLMKKMDAIQTGDQDEMEKVMLKAKAQESELTDKEKLMQTPVKLIREGL